MAVQTNHLLLTALMSYANYSEKQLLKSGQIAEVASQILQRRRKAAQRITWVLIGLVATPVVITTIARILGRTEPVEIIFLMSCFAALTQIPTLIYLRSSQARLETLMAAWLMNQQVQDASPEPESSIDSLAQLVFTNS